MIDGMLRLLLFMGNEIIPEMNILRNFNHDKVLCILKHIKIQKVQKAWDYPRKYLLKIGIDFSIFKGSIILVDKRNTFSRFIRKLIK